MITNNRDILYRLEEIYQVRGMAGFEHYSRYECFREETTILEALMPILRERNSQASTRVWSFTDDLVKEVLERI